MMEIKKWNDYNPEEKIKLLQHWWYYYGKVLITLAEWQHFSQLVKKDSNSIFLIAVTSYISGKGSQYLVLAIRDNRVNELITALQKVEETADEHFKTEYTRAENSFISMLVGSYNNPKPSVPMEPSVMAEQFEEIVKRKKKTTENY